MNQELDLFEYFETQPLQPVSPAEEKKESPKPLSPAKLRQAAFAFLVSLHPDGIAENVSTRRSKLCADAACFWRVAHSRNPLQIARTALVVVNKDLNRCFADCADRDARLEEISALQRRKEILEAEIRQTEPHLAAADDLFSEFRTWNYEQSANPEYRKVRKILDKKMRQLCQGSRLERIRQAGVADLLFLATPEGLISPELVPPMWGLVEISRSGKRFNLVKNATIQENVSPSGRLALTVNIASAALNSTRFAAGVDADSSLRRPPRRRGKMR